jgi:hypothetical protein
VENEDDHSVVLIPCDCCEATTMSVQLDAAKVAIRIEDINRLEELRNCMSAAIDYHKGRTSFPGDEDDADCPPRRWRGHAPSLLRETFQDWLDEWLLEDELSDDDRRDFKEDYLPSLSGCTDILPCHYCECLDLPHGSTYGEAVEVVRLRM